MRHRSASLLSIAAASLFLCCCGGGSSAKAPVPGPPGPAPILAFTQIANGLSSPVDLQVPGDGSGRLFIVEQNGTLRIIANGAVLATAFLDISSKIDAGGEKGLLGLAFHPQYAQNGRFFVHYDRLLGGQMQSVIAEYQKSAGNADQADPASERILLTVDQPFPNHKGGRMAFGPDGFLYIGFGDGGSGGDPLGNGQNLQTLLGKMLRIDVDHTSSGLQYAIPTDNPFVSGGGRGEIWAYGLRNPWRFSFEKGGLRLFVGDVGQDKYEEIDVIQKGGNFGWNTTEGMHCYSPATNCNMSGLTLPIAEYDHSEGEAVIGGYVYKGSAIPSLAGSYIFGDYISGTVWQLKEAPANTWTRTKLLSSGKQISSFGQDESGELYLVDYIGNIFKLVAQ